MEVYMPFSMVENTNERKIRFEDDVIPNGPITCNENGSSPDNELKGGYAPVGIDLRGRCDKVSHGVDDHGR